MTSSFDTRAYCIDNKVASFSLGLTFDETNQKKQIEPVSWGKISLDNFTKYHDNKKRGFAILTGSINNLVVIDCDINKAAGKFPQDILDTLDGCCKSVVKTPNGKHYYFRCSKILKKRTGAYWKGTKVPFLDVLAEKAMILAPPSLYLRGDDVAVYRWITGDLSTLVELPEAIEDAIAEPEHSSATETATLTASIDVLLNALSIERWSDYEEWISIGMALYNSGYTLDVWDTYSKKAPNYKPGACAEKWKTFGGKKTNAVGLGTLYYKLKQDNPEVFETLRSNIEDTHIRCATRTHQSTATLFYLSNPNRYTFSPQLGWFSLGENNIWIACEEQPERFMMRISNVVTDFCDSARDYFTEKAKKEEDEERKKHFLTFAAGCVAHKQQVQNTGYVKSTIEWVRELYTDSLFYQKLNSNRNLLAFSDKVFDFESGEYRPILPSDYISIHCPMAAPSLTEPTEPRLKAFLDSLWENDDDLNYVLKTLASCLDGFNRFQECYMWKGPGGNGKSMLMNLLVRGLGDYVKDLPMTYFTQKVVTKSSPLPELADCAFSRFVSTCESETNEKIQVGFLKHLSGDEDITVRKLYGKPFSYRPQFNIFILCNGVKLSRVDEAIPRRLRVIYFPFLFKNPQDFNPSHPFHRKSNPNLAKILEDPDVISSFMALLLKTYKEHQLYTAETIFRPENVLQATSEFLLENNPIAPWLFKHYDTKADIKKCVAASELLNNYKIDTGKECSPNQFASYLSILGFESKKTKTMRYYYGFERKQTVEFEE